MSTAKYDFLIVGAGLFGAVCAHELAQKGYKVLVIDKRNHIGGNIYTKEIENIHVHYYGAHIFHTSDLKVWEYINQFAKFNNFINSPIAIYKGQRYHLPFNMNTFHEIWPDVVTEDDARKRIEEDKASYQIDEPKNLKEQAIKLVGPTIFTRLIEGYTAKQWGHKCEDLPPFIIKRIPVRFTYDNNYFNDTYQGIPIGGYTKIIEKMLEGIDVVLDCDFISNKKEYQNIANKIIYSGTIDEYYDYQFGPLEYRTVRFEHEVLNQKDYQGNAVINYTEYEVPYTRIIEHKYFDFADQEKTVISKEYPSKWDNSKEPYYPVNNEENNARYQKYEELAKKESNIYFGGRLGKYRYLDMDDTILDAFKMIEEVTK